MKIEMKMRSLDRITGLRSFVEQDLHGLQRELPIECAHIVLEQELEKSPRYRAAVLLVVPGPDLHAAASDHTILAAWRKTHAGLMRQIRERKSQRFVRQKINLQVRGSRGG